MDTALSPHRHSVYDHHEGIILAASRRLSALWPGREDSWSINTHTHTQSQSQWLPLSVKRWLGGPVGWLHICTLNHMHTQTRTHTHMGVEAWLDPCPVLGQSHQISSPVRPPTVRLWDTPLGLTHTHTHIMTGPWWPSRKLALEEMDTHFDTSLRPSGSNSPNEN